MSYCDNKDKENYLNIDCNIVGINGHQENGPGDIYEVNRMKDVKVVDSTPSAMEDEQTITAPSDNGSNQQINRLANVADKKKKMNDKKSWNSKKCGGNTSGGDDNHDVLSKKRKTRRGKPKPRKTKPYLKNILYSRVRRQSNRSTQPPAPYNTTQFLMEDHSDLPEFEPKLAEGTGATITTAATTSLSSSSSTTIPTSSRMTTTSSFPSDIPELFQKPNPPPRTRDSSFSIDSEDDYFYSSPEDEEEFLTKEFSSAYEDLHAERLNLLSKHDLLQEYLQLESKLEHITKRIKSKNLQCDDDNNKTTNTDDVTKKLKFYQQKIDDLLQQNDQLKRDNEELRGKRKNSVSSIDSESDSDSSSSSTSNHSDNSACGGGGGGGGDKDKSDFDKNLLEEDIHSDDTSTKDSSSPLHSNSVPQIKVVDGLAI